MEIFIGYALSDASKAHMTKIQEQLAFQPHAKLTRENNFHLTILYHGTLTQAQLANYVEQLRQAEITPVNELIVQGVTTFTKKNQHIIVADVVKTPELAQAFEQVQAVVDACELPFAYYPTFRPHVTLARQKNAMIECEFHEKMVLPVTGLMIFLCRQTDTGITYEVIAKL